MTDPGGEGQSGSWRPSAAPYLPCADLPHTLECWTVRYPEWFIQRGWRRAASLRRKRLAVASFARMSSAINAARPPAAMAVCSRCASCGFSRWNSTAMSATSPGRAEGSRPLIASPSSDPAHSSAEASPSAKGVPDRLGLRLVGGREAFPDLGRRGVQQPPRHEVGGRGAGGTETWTGLSDGVTGRRATASGLPQPGPPRPASTSWRTT